MRARRIGPSAGIALALLSTACAGKQRVAAAPEPAHVPAPAAEPHADEGPPARDPFELDEASDDPEAALESMKHNCCEAMPEREVQEHVSPPGQ